MATVGGVFEDVVALELDTVKMGQWSLGGNQLYGFAHDLLPLLRRSAIVFVPLLFPPLFY